jgi:phosphatidate phosphatase APP1
MESGEFHIQAYRGYGTRTRLHLAARVLRGRPLDPAQDDHTLWDNLLDAYRRFESDEVPGARVGVAYGAVRTTVTTDEEGYLHLDLDVPEGVADGAPWHQVELTLQEPLPGGHAVGSRVPVRVPGPEAEVGIISDVDDTVLVTGARSLRSMARLTFLHNARTRLPFPGVGALYRALAAGSDGTRSNPVFYVSSSPWNLYDLLVDFFRLRDLPRGVLLLRDLGLTAEHWVAGGHEHKEEKIEAILRTYPHLPFVLLGDSGQQDPEIYSRVAAGFPGRIPVIYIRDVTGPTRDAEVRRLAERTTEAGTPMRLVRDSLEAARDAAARGLIAPEAVEGVRAALEEEETRPTPEEALGGA